MHGLGWIEGCHIEAQYPILHYWSEHRINNLTAGTLFIVATPIGNLDDLSARAKQVLADVDVIAAEDTRHSGRLLSHFGISTRLLALHDHNEAEAAGGVIERLRNGESVALVSDAGTPLISDPGFQLVRRAHDADIRVCPIPGPSAAIAALSAAGLPSDRFAFEGFLPAKHEARKKKLMELKDDTRTLILFESVHRIGDAMRDMLAILGDRPAFIGRELSKLFEQCLNSSLDELVRKIETGEIVAKGEFVIVVSGAEKASSDQAMIKADELLAELMQQLPGSQAVDIVSKLGGEKRNDVYKKMLELKE